MPARTQTNCPFYGQQMSFVFHLPDLVALIDPRGSMQKPDFAPFHLVATKGNQCALITSAHSPCQLENIGQPVEWTVCPFVIGRLMMGRR